MPDSLNSASVIPSQFSKSRRLFSARPMTASISLSLFAAMSAVAALSAGQNSLKDVQVGEEGRLMRIALVCENGCDVTKLADNQYELANIDSSLTIPLEGRSALLQGLRFHNAGPASLLSLISDRTVAEAKINDCVVREIAATCIDLEFSVKTLAVNDVSEAVDANASSQPEQTQQIASKERIAVKTPSIEENPQVTASAQNSPAQVAAASQSEAFVKAAVAPPRPTLRTAPNRDMLTFARYAAPERLSPPKLAVITPVSSDAPGRLEVSAMPKKIPQQVFSMRDEAVHILDQSFGVAECAGAQARLNRDAWALDAMVEVGFCKALNGNLQEADELFNRLLTYTPDSYSALVGRALIAAENGEIGTARDYFQDALNAMPPNKESDRIIRAMRNL